MANMSSLEIDNKINYINGDPSLSKDEKRKAISELKGESSTSKKGGSK